MLQKITLSVFGTLVCIAALLGGAACAIVFCTYRALLPLEIGPNDAWNAWNSAAIERLYPDLSQLITNNYPPLYFYLFDLERVYAGRVVSILASLLLSFIAYRMARVLGSARLGAAAGAIWFLA